MQSTKRDGYWTNQIDHGQAAVIVWVWPHVRRVREQSAACAMICNLQTPELCRSETSLQHERRWRNATHPFQKVVGTPTGMHCGAVGCGCPSRGPATHKRAYPLKVEAKADVGMAGTVDGRRESGSGLRGSGSGLWGSAPLNMRVLRETGHSVEQPPKPSTCRRAGSASVEPRTSRQRGLTWCLCGAHGCGVGPCHRDKRVQGGSPGKAIRRR